MPVQIPKTFLILLFLLIAVGAPVFAQETGFGVATTYELAETEVEDGDIISMITTETGIEFRRAATDYDENMFGVVVSTPPVVIRRSQDGVPIVQTGDALVNVATTNGPIKAGDYITSSTIAGKGQKATERSKYVLGLALEPFDGSQGETGQIRVSLNIGLATASLVKPRLGFTSFLDELGITVLQNVKEVEGAARFVRYLLAAMVSLFAIIFAFVFFGRGMVKGIEAMGRNPLAKQSIQFMVIINAVLLGVVSIGAIILSLVIIRL